MVLQLKGMAVPSRDTQSVEMEETAAQIMCVGPRSAAWLSTVLVVEHRPLSWNFLLVFLSTTIKIRDDNLGSAFPCSSNNFPVFGSILPYSSWNLPVFWQFWFFFGHTFWILGRNIARFLLCSRLFNVHISSQKWHFHKRKKQTPVFFEVLPSHNPERIWSAILWNEAC